MAALAVVAGHSLALAGQGAHDPVARLAPGYPLATLAVYVFFAVSGYLVTSSLLRNPGMVRYLRNRVLRVYPGYVVCILATVFVLGPFLTSHQVSGYFSSAGVWDYLRENGLPLTFAWSLPGVFETNPFPSVVNGTLWSLGLEVRWYFYLALLSLVGVVGRRRVFTSVAIAFLAIGVWEAFVGVPDLLHYRALSQTFVLAALAAHWLHRPTLPAWPLIAMLGLFAALAGTVWAGALIALTAVYGTLWIAYSAPLLRWPPELDYSYGLFLYGFPVQQAIVAWCPGISGLALFAVSLPAAGACAVVSWHLVEKPSLALKHRRQPLPAV